MGYSISVENSLIDKLKKLKKRDPISHERILRKSRELLENPELGKPLRYGMKNVRRVHVGHFVLTYKVDDKAMIVTLIDYEHHDDAY